MEMIQILSSSPADGRRARFGSCPFFSAVHAVAIHSSNAISYLFHEKLNILRDRYSYGGARAESDRCVV